MTAATLARLPLMAGGTLVGTLGQGGFWTLSRLIEFGVWGVGQFMRAPVAITTIAAVAGFSLLAGSNALYFQSGRHPAPLFFTPAHTVAPRLVEPVVPAPRPRVLPTSDDTETTGSVAGQVSPTRIDNTDVLALQQKLVALKLLDGAPDGIFGHRTAAAIRAFQAKAGLRPDGKLTPGLLVAVAGAPVGAAQAWAPAQPIPEITTTAALPAPVPAKPVPLAAAAPTVPVATAPAPAAATAAATTAAPMAFTPDTPVAAAPAEAAPPPPTDTFAANSEVPADPAPPAIAAAPSASSSVAREDLTAGNSVAMTAPAQPRPVTNDASLSPGQRLAAQVGTLPPEAARGSAYAPPPAVSNDTESSIDPVLISKIQRGLASLGFLAQKIDGVPGEGTAKAIRNFEVFYDYKITGLATRQLLDLLVQHGAQI